MFAMTFGKKVTQIRLNKGWKQQDLARAIADVSPSTVSAWESKDAVPGLDLALKTARALGVSLDYLADESLDAEPEPSDSKLTLEEQMVLNAMRAFGFEETWRRLHPSLSEPTTNSSPEYSSKVDRAKAPEGE